MILLMQHSIPVDEGFVPLFVTSGTATSLTSIRLLRLFRPLREMNSMNTMKVIVTSLISSGPEIASVLSMLVFIFSVFAIIGVQLFGGQMNNVCLEPLNYNASNLSAIGPYVVHDVDGQGNGESWMNERDLASSLEPSSDNGSPLTRAQSDTAEEVLLVPLLGRPDFR